MPVVGFACPRGRVRFETCLQECAPGAEPPCKYPYAVLAGIMKGIRGPQPPNEVTATELTGCLLRAYCRRSQEAFVKPAAAFWAFRGQMAHAIAQGCAAPGALVEQRIAVPLDGLILSGQPDTLEPIPDAGYRLLDYKSTMRLPHAPRSHHLRQVDIYSYLGLATGIAVRQTVLIYFDMSGLLSFARPVDSAQVRAFVETAILPQAQALVPAVQSGNAPSPGPFREDWECGYCDYSRDCAHKKRRGK